MKITEIQKPSSHEEELFLSTMIDTLMLYNSRLSELEQKYEKIRCTLITPCYFNFRDALLHYEQAYHSQEIIQLYCEQNAMQEHLHRAMKDGCVRYIHLISERLYILYRYRCTPERLKKLTERVSAIAQSAGVTLDDIDRVGTDCFALAKYLPRVAREDLLIVYEYIFNVNGGTLPAHRKLLQKAFHVMGNLELDSRNSSMHIGKPFFIMPDKTTGKAPIDFFFDICDQQFSMIQSAGLEDFVIAARMLEKPVLGNRYVVEQFQWIERDCVKRLDVSLYYGVCKRNPSILDRPNRRVSHCFHEVKQKVLLPFSEGTPPRKKSTLLIGQLCWINLIGKELRQGDAKCSTHRLKCRQCRSIVPVKHICDRGMGEIGLLCKSIVCPATFLHHLPYAALCVHFITRPSVTIIIPKKVL